MDHNAKSEPDQEQQPGFKPRRASRVMIDQPANLCPQNWYNIEVKIRNVSTCGFMAECTEPVRIGSYVSLDVPGLGPVHAQVRWQIGAAMGGMFLDPISLNRCEWIAEKTKPPVEKAEA